MTDRNKKMSKACQKFDKNPFRGQVQPGGDDDRATLYRYPIIRPAPVSFMRKTAAKHLL